MVQAGGSTGGINRDGDRFNMGSSSEASLFAHAPHEVIEGAIKAVAHDLLDDAILNVAFEIHRSMKRGLLVLENGIPDDEGKFKQVDIEGLDVFGHPPGKKQHECICPNCSRNLAASRFAPHLEKCMGMGRNSSRIASRRIQNSTRESSTGGALIGQGSDDDDDDDWNIDRDRKRNVERERKRKRDKNSPRRSRSLKIKSEPYVSSSSGNSSNGNSLLSSHITSNGSTYSTSTLDKILLSSSLEERRILLSQVCGVVSEHTRKICTRSQRCPQHTNEQRKIVRDQYLSNIGSDSILGGSGLSLVDSTSHSNGKYASLLDGDDVQVESDALDAEVSHLTSSWDHDLSNTTSPADSTSTNNSSSTATTSSSSSSSNTKRSSSASSSGKSKKKSSKSSKKDTQNIILD